MTKEKLKTLINDFADKNKLFKSVEKECNSLKSDIKDTMSDMKITDFDTGDYTAVLSTVTKETMDEELLIPFIKNLNIRGIVKEKEYVDMDALEKAIYSGKLSQENLIEMNKCKTSISYTTLRVKKNKKGK